MSRKSKFECIVTVASVVVPIALFAAIPLLDIYASEFFWIYLIFYVVTCGTIILIKDKFRQRH